MKQWGVGLTIIGAIVAAIALLLMKSTVPIEGMTTLPLTGDTIGTGRYSDTYNLPLAQLREMIFQGGCVLFLGGAVLLVGGTIEELLKTRFSTDARSVADLPVHTDSMQPSPEYVTEYPEDVETDAVSSKMLARGLFGLIVLAGAIGLIATVMNAPKDGVVAPHSPATDSANAAENASRAADEAIAAADRAARRAGQ